MRHIIAISVIIWALLALILNLSVIGQFVVLAVIANSAAWSCFFAFVWLSTLVLFLTIVEVVLSAIYENSDEARIRRNFKI